MKNKSRLSGRLVGNNLLFILIIPTFASWKNMLRTLAILVLPTQILESFTIVSRREVGSEFHISLDERLEDYYHIDGHTFEKQYKEVLNGTRQNMPTSGCSFLTFY